MHIYVKSTITFEHTTILTSLHDYYTSFFRSSHQMCCMKKGVLRNFPKFTGKPLCYSLFFCGEFCEIFKNTFSSEHLRTSASALGS